MEHKLLFEYGIDRWDEAVPLGNGRIGTLIWGDPLALRFSLDRTDIWDLSTPVNVEQKDFCYRNLVELARRGETERIRELFDAPYNYPAPTKLPAGKLILHFPEGVNVRTELSFQLAEATLEIQSRKNYYKIRSVCHAVTGSGMIQVDAGTEMFSVELQHPGYGRRNEKEDIHYNLEKREISQGSLKRLRYPAAVRGKIEGTPTFFWFVQKVDEAFSYGVVVGMLEEQEKTLIFYRIATSNEGKKWAEEAIEQLRGELQEGYDKNIVSHRKWWADFWGKSSIILPDKFFEKQWYLTNYLLASCSRKGSYPMPLQGVWTADDGCLPPWKGDYHHDLNTQLSYSHFYKANHLEEGESFLDFLWESREEAKKFAAKFYGTDGICLPGVMTIDGQPLGGWPMYSLSPAHQIWLCQSFELYYRCTGDMEFLRERAWVYFEETAKCITALLEEGDDGYLYFPVSSSPELHDDETTAWVMPNSNYDLALLRYLYHTLIDFSKRLKNGRDEEWGHVLMRLPGLAVNEKNVLMISPDESLEESHRHLSNAMAICPLHLYCYETAEEKAIIDAVIQDYERLGTGMWVGFSFAWMAHLYAIQKNGEGAFDRLRIFWESFCSPNGFHLNGDYKKRGYTTFHYRLFTLEANMYAADALQEMLFQMEDGRIDLFPAIPEKWEDGIAFKHLRGEQGILVSAKMRAGRWIDVTLSAEYEQNVYIRYKTDSSERICLGMGETKNIRLEIKK